MTHRYQGKEGINIKSNRREGIHKLFFNETCIEEESKLALTSEYNPKEGSE